MRIVSASDVCSLADAVVVLCTEFGIEPMRRATRLVVARSSVARTATEVAPCTPAALARAAIPAPESKED